MVVLLPGEWSGFRGFVSRTQWADLLSASARSAHERGDFLLQQGEPGGVVRLLSAGRVKVVFSGSDGRQVLLCLRGPGELLGELADTDTGTRMASVVAMEAGVSYSLSIDLFRESLRRNRIERDFQRYTMSKMRQTGPQQWFAACGRVDSRLAGLLLDAMRVAGPEHRAPLHVPLSQEELAAALGVARSSVTLWIKRWKRAGLLEVERGGVVLRNLDALREVANGSLR